MGAGPGLGSPLIVHTRPGLAPLVAAQLSAGGDVPEPVLVVTPSDQTGARVVAAGVLGVGGRSGGALRVIDAHEVSTMTLLDGKPGHARAIVEAMNRSIRNWTAGDLRGKHPALFLLGEEDDRDGTEALLPSISRSHIERLLGAFTRRDLSLRFTGAFHQEARWMGDVAGLLFDSSSPSEYRSGAPQDPVTAALCLRRDAVALVELFPELLASLGVALEAASDRVALSEEMLKKIAQGIHERYLDVLPAEVRAKPRDSQRPWAELDDVFRLSNIAQARRIFPKLAILGLEPVWDDGVSGSAGWPDGFRMNDEALEVVAESEHQGWCDYLLKRGFKHGPKRDVVERLHPDLKPYGRLTDETKQKDRNTVGTIPELLAEVGIRVVAPGGGRDGS
jgi:hypothetical protein